MSSHGGRRLLEADSVAGGLGVDAVSTTGAFRLHEYAGMAPAFGWVRYEKELGTPSLTVAGDGT